MSETRRLLLEFETEEVGALARKKVKYRKALVKAFSDTSDIVRERALIAAIDLADPTIVTNIVDSMTDDIDNVRISAAQAVAWYRQPVAIPILIRGLKDTNTWVRSHCALGLSKLMHGPIWARLNADVIDTILADFPDMIEAEIRSFLSKINMIPEAIDSFMKWRISKFNIEIDVSSLVEELEGKPIILTKAIEEDLVKPSKISDEVEKILSEIPKGIRSTLPPEDLRRLTPDTARELVDSLKESFPEEKKKKGKKVKVKRVKRVRKKRKAPTREDLIARIPPDIRDSLSDEVIDSLSIEDLEALIATTDEDTTVKVEPAEEEIPELPEKIDDSRWEGFVEKYGEEKARLLIAISPEMIDGIPEEQILEMDVDTIKGLSDALDHT